MSEVETIAALIQLAIGAAALVVLWRFWCLLGAIKDTCEVVVEYCDMRLDQESTRKSSRR